MKKRYFFYLIVLFVALLILKIKLDANKIVKSTDGITIKTLTSLNVILQTPLNSNKNKRGDVFSVTIKDDLKHGNDVVISKNTKINGLVKRVDKYNKKTDKAAILLIFDQLILNNDKVIPISASIDTNKNTNIIKIPGKSEQNIKLVSKTTIAGALMGQTVSRGDKEGTYKGLLAGYVAGTGAVFMKNRMEVDLPIGTEISIKLDSDLFIPKS